MRSTDKTRVAAFVLALAATTTASQAMAEILILRSSGPIAQRLRAGAMLPEVRPIRLGANDTLDLLSDTGTWSWRGPGDFPNAMGVARTASAIVAPDRRRTRVGAVRSVGGEPTARPNIWMVDVAEPGAVCVMDTGAPLLWRRDTEAAITLVLAGPGGASAEVHWAAGEAIASWPTGVPVVEGASYRLTGQGTTATVSIVVRTLDAAPASAPAAGMALIERGCEAQVDLLAAQMEQRDELAGS